MSNNTTIGEELIGQDVQENSSALIWDTILASPRMDCQKPQDGLSTGRDLNPGPLWHSVGFSPLPFTHQAMHVTVRRQTLDWTVSTVTPSSSASTPLILRACSTNSCWQDRATHGERWDYGSTEGNKESCGQQTCGWQAF